MHSADGYDLRCDLTAKISRSDYDCVDFACHTSAPVRLYLYLIHDSSVTSQSVTYYAKKYNYVILC